jgi:rifampicin phosphotransferase
MVQPHTVRAPSPSEASVIDLDDPGAVDAGRVGAKAAALATARRAGFPVQDGAVLTTGGLARWRTDPGVREELRRSWARVTADGRSAVIVRSSSTVEDTEQSSMAGRFRSILDRDTFASVCAAIDEVIEHAAGVSAAPLAVLVQPMLDARVGGVLFGADPVHARTDRFVVAAIPSGPDALVSGAEHGARYTITPRGHVVESEAPLPQVGRRELRELAALARSLNRLFGRPQDIEWAIDTTGALRLLQSRPITTVARAPRRARGPILGPGPVAETFPDRLSVLESQLWVRPLDEGVREAMVIAGVRRSAARPIVSDLDGWVVADLGALEPPPRTLWTIIDPRRGARRLRAAWRTGRLRATLPPTARRVVDDTDEQLGVVPPLATLGDEDLVLVIDRAAGLLRSLHAYEVLCGLAMRRSATVSATGASAALDALAVGRSRGLDDDAIIAAWPEVLALVPPAVRSRTPLPPVRPRPAAGLVPRPAEVTAGIEEELARQREHLRLRSRWVHELMALGAFELGRRFAARGWIAGAPSIRDVGLEEIRRAVTSGVAPEPAPPRAGSLASVPARFVLDDRGRPVPVPSSRRRSRAEGQGAGGGRSVGRVVSDRAEAGPGTVLVVATLDPALASVLPGLGGLVAETGSVLSHLAILAREHGVATVVGVPDARRRWPPGSMVEVDGTAGTVVVVDPGVPSEASVAP